MGEVDEEDVAASEPKSRVPRAADQWIGLALGAVLIVVAARLLEPIWADWALDLIRRRGLWTITHELLVPAMVGAGGTAVALASWQTSRSATRIARDAADSEKQRAIEAKAEAIAAAEARQRDAEARRTQLAKEDMDRRTGELVEAIYRFREKRYGARAGRNVLPSNDEWLPQQRLVEMAMLAEDRPFVRAVYDMLVECGKYSSPANEGALDGIAMLLLGWRRGGAGIDEANALKVWVDEKNRFNSSKPFPYTGMF